MSSIEQLLFTMVLVAALGCGLVAGIFFAFSAFLMRALSRLPPGEGMAAMQSINVAVLNPWFLGTFLGTAAICLAASVVSLFRWHEPDAVFLLSGGTLYLVGTLMVTMAFNVPRNEALASVSPEDPEYESQWNRYVASWTAWNHVRTVAALGAAACFGIALGS